MSDAPQYARVAFAGIEVYYTSALDGGGAGSGQDFLHYVGRWLGPRRRIFEWCAGPGFIGFSLLAHGLCDSLCLADVDAAAVAACRLTIVRNGLERRVSVYHSDCFARIPQHERWDLVVGNPPHSGSAAPIARIQRPLHVYQDVGWELHRRFYRRVADFLAPGGEVLVQENALFSTVDTFRPMIEAGGLRIVDAPVCATTHRRCYYYIRSAPSVRAARAS
jgi:hypothetical protein